MSWLSRNRVLFFFLVVFLISGTTYFLIQIARGYRFDLTEKGLKAHGLLALKSQPDGAKIYINGVLKGATDTTIALTPGKYQVDVEIDGFNHWSKLLTINKELVTLSDIFMFPLVPNLQSLTYEGVNSPTLSPDGSKIAYLSTANKNITGVWVYEINNGLIDFNRSPRLVFTNVQNLINNTMLLSWSPDNKWLIAKNNTNAKGYLINPNQTNTLSEITTRSADYTDYEKLWNTNLLVQQQIDLKRLPAVISSTLKENTNNLTFSSDNLKVLYTATNSANLPAGLTTPPPTASTQNENRAIVPNLYYVYDYKEDKNFVVPYQPPQPIKDKTTTKQTITLTNNIPRWLPSSNHLYWVEENEGVFGIWVCEYDGTNKTLVFNGNFNPNYVFTSPTMGKLIILSNLGVDLNDRPNLFTLDLLH